MTPPSEIADELAARGWTREWFDAHDEATGSTVLLLRAALRRAALWGWVDAEVSTSVGCLEFRATDLGGLRRRLARHPSFSTPRGSRGAWSSRERVAVAALHLKHFAHWPDDLVQAHLDPVGLLPGRRPWASPLRWALLASRHLRDRRGYLDVARLEGLLRERGAYATRVDIQRSTR